MQEGDEDVEERDVGSFDHLRMAEPARSRSAQAKPRMNSTWRAESREYPRPQSSAQCRSDKLLYYQLVTSLTVELDHVRARLAAHLTGAFETRPLLDLQDRRRSGPRGRGPAAEARSARSLGSRPLNVPLIEIRPTSISASTSAVSPRISSLPERILPSNFPSIRKVSSKVSSPWKWLPRSRKPVERRSFALDLHRSSETFTSFRVEPLVEPDQLFLGARSLSRCGRPGGGARSGPAPEPARRASPPRPG